MQISVPVKVKHKSKSSGRKYGARLSPISCWLITLTIILASIRGLIVLHSNVDAATVYHATAFLLLILAICGLIKSTGGKNPDLALLRRLLGLNLFLGIVNVAVDLLLGVSFDPSILYLCVAPYIIYIYLCIPRFYLTAAAAAIALAISYSVCDNFYESRNGQEGYDHVFAYNQKLRPETFEALSRTGENYRASGYTGSYHDSAEILGMAAAFFFIRFIIKRKMADLAVFSLAMISMTMTQSAANILVAIATILIFTCYSLLAARKFRTAAGLILAMSSVGYIYSKFGNVMTIFTARVGPEGDWVNMFNGLDPQTLFHSIPFFFFGHAAAFSSRIIVVEAAFIKTIYQLGVFHATILYWILLYPLMRFIKVRSFCSAALPAAAAIFFGFMSLVHYGSLFRETNIFLFYAFYVICLVRIRDCECQREEAMRRQGSHDHRH